MWKPRLKPGTDPWEAAARALRLSLRPDGRGICGRTIEFEVSIGWGSDDDSTIIQLDAAQRILAAMGEPGLVIKSRAPSDAGKGGYTGDASFDAQVFLRGREELLSASMATEGRRRVLAFAERGGTLQSGIFKLTTKESESTVEGVLRLARLALEAAETFLVRDVAQSLEENAASDSVVGVRLRNLELLQLHYPNSPQCERAMQMALRDRAPEVVLAGARIAGESSWAPLVRLLEDPAESPAIRCAVFEHLIGDAENAGVPHLLLSALRAVDQRVRYAGVIAFARLAELSNEVAEDLSLRDALFKAMTPALAAELAKGVAIALGSTDDARSEPLLITFLAHDLLEVRLWAAASLSRIGTAKAVEPLLELSRGGPLNRRANLAALDAVRAIQGRLGIVDEGRLTLARSDLEEGAISLAAEPGAVSLAPGQG